MHAAKTAFRPAVCTHEQTHHYKHRPTSWTKRQRRKQGRGRRERKSKIGRFSTLPIFNILPGRLINGGGHKVNIYIQGREASGPALQIPFEIIEGVFNAADADITKITERILVSCEAEVDAWAVLTFWALHDENPPSTSFEFNGGEIFVRAWNIGHKYGLAKFQDSMMGEMLWGLNDSAASMAARVSAFEGSAPGSVMRRLLAEDLAREIDGGDLTLAKLTELYTIPGFEAELLQALKQQHVHSNPEMRIPGEEENATGPWKKFMVGQGPWS